MRGRPKTPLIIPRQPAVGSTWVIQKIDSGELCRCSATTQADKPHVEALRKFSGAQPFFTVRLGSKRTHVVYLKFPCGSHLLECIDTTATWKWIDITLDEAHIKGLWFSEPNLVENPLDFADFPQLPETDFKSIDDLTNPD